MELNGIKWQKPAAQGPAPPRSPHQEARRAKGPTGNERNQARRAKGPTENETNQARKAKGPTENETNQARRAKGPTENETNQARRTKARPRTKQTRRGRPKARPRTKQTRRGGPKPDRECKNTRPETQENTRWPVSRVLSARLPRRDGHSSGAWRYRKPRATNPGDGVKTRAGAEAPISPLFGFAPGGVYRDRPCCQVRGALLPHPFTLT